MKNVPDELIRELRGARGDLPNPGGGRWGKVLLLHTAAGPNQTAPRTTVTFIQTELLPTVTPMAVMLRFSLDGQTFTPAVPGAFGGSLRIDMIETVDMKAGAFRESFTLEADDVQPLCGVICRALNLSVTIEGENASIWVQAVAAPTQTIDCADIVGPPVTTPAGITSTATARYAALTAATYNIAANTARALLSLSNQSAANLYVHLGAGVTITPGSEFATIILPPSAFAGYEVLNYRGEVTFRFDADDGSGYTLVTEGLY